jgi:hypothetical protein
MPDVDGGHCVSCSIVDLPLTGAAVCVALTDGEDVKDCDGVFDGVLVGEENRLGVTDGVTVELGEIVGVGLADDPGLRVMLADDDTDCEALGVSDADGVRDADDVTVGVTDCEMLEDSDSVGVTVGVLEGDAPEDNELVGDGVSDSDAVGDSEMLLDRDTLLVSEDDRELDLVEEALAGGDCVAVMDTFAPPEPPGNPPAPSSKLEPPGIIPLPAPPSPFKLFPFPGPGRVRVTDRITTNAASTSTATLMALRRQSHANQFRTTLLRLR